MIDPSLQSPDFAAMIPIRDHNPSDRTPFVTYALIAANVLIFIGYSDMFSNPRQLMAFYDAWALFPNRVSQGEDLHGLFSTMFLHGGWMHLGGNMLFLWIFGDNLEDEMGHVGFLIFYLLSGLAAAFAHVIAAPWSAVPTVGASGAIAGVMGGYLLLFPRARVDLLFIIVFFIRIFTVPAWLMLAVWFGLQVFSGVGADASTGGVAYWAHAGGFVAGFVLVLPLWLKRGATRFWRQHQGHPPHPEARYEYSQSRIPTVRRKR